jgi:hypothetical protein
MEASRTGAVSTAAPDPAHRRDREGRRRATRPGRLRGGVHRDAALVFFVGMVVVMNSAGGLGVTDFAVIGLVHFLVLAVLVHTLGGASGAHFNPAVTITLAACARSGRSTP